MKKEPANTDRDSAAQYSTVVLAIPTSQPTVYCKQHNVQARKQVLLLGKGPQGRCFEVTVIACTVRSTRRRYVANVSFAVRNLVY